MTSPSTEPLAPVLLANGWWRLRHSIWLIAPIAGLGLFSFVGFVYVGLRARTKLLLTMMGLSLAATILLWVAAFQDSDPAVEGSQTSGFVGGMTAIFWLVSMVAALAVNRNYLRWRAHQAAEIAALTGNLPLRYLKNTRFHPTPAPPPPNVPVQPESFAQSSGATAPSTSEYFAPGRVARPLVTPASSIPAPTTSPVVNAPPPPPGFGAPRRVAPDGPPAAPIMAAPSSTITPASVAAAQPAVIDGNTATVSDLIAADVSSQLAERIVAARDVRGGFRDLEDVRVAVALQPHEFVSLRSKLTFTRAQGPNQPPLVDPGVGRLLDI